MNANELFNTISNAIQLLILHTNVFIAINDNGFIILMTVDKSECSSY